MSINYLRRNVTINARHSRPVKLHTSTTISNVGLEVELVFKETEGNTSGPTVLVTAASSSSVIGCVVAIVFVDDSVVMIMLSIFDLSRI